MSKEKSLNRPCYRLSWNESVSKAAANNTEWLDALMAVLRVDSQGAHLVKALRPRLLAVNILRKITCYMTSDLKKCGETMMQFLAETHWVPLRVLPETAIRPAPSICPVESSTSSVSSSSSTCDTPEVASDCCWSVDKLAACTGSVTFRTF